MNDSKLKWIFLGTMNNFKSDRSGGVYLLTLSGLLNRVLYVGTTRCFEKRISQHKTGFLQGNRTLWNVKPDEDVYTLMSIYEIRDYIKYFKELSKSGKVWASTTLEITSPKNLLNRDHKFDEFWKSYVRNEYLDRVNIWGLRIDPYAIDEAVKIESAIQQRLVEVFKLGNFFNHKDISVLGKIERNKYRVTVGYEIENSPDIDEASCIVLNSLRYKHIPLDAYEIARAQLSEVINERRRSRIEKRKRIKLINSAFHKQGEPWSKMDLEKLRLMLVDFEMSHLEISEYLLRSPKAIKKMIDKNDSLSRRKWRESIEYLD